MKKNIQLIIVLITILSIFIYHQEITNNINIATKLFQNKIFPSLFPIMIISPFLINYGFLNITKKLIGPIMKIFFNLSEYTSYIFIMSLLSGFPGSAIYAKELYDKKLINKKEIEHLILFCHFPNPIFVITMISTNHVKILATHYFISFIIGILTKNKQLYKQSILNPEKTKVNFIKTFTNSIKNGINNSLFILGVIVFFFTISSIIKHPITNIFLEISQGLNYIKSINYSNQLKNALTGALLGFGSLSIHLQTYGILSDLNFNYSKYLKTRLIHALLSFLIFYTM